MLVVEANLAGGYDIGLTWALDLARRMQAQGAKAVELVIAGRVHDPAAAVHGAHVVACSAAA